MTEQQIGYAAAGVFAALVLWRTGVLGWLVSRVSRASLPAVPVRGLAGPWKPTIDDRLDALCREILAASDAEAQERAMSERRARLRAAILAADAPGPAAAATTAAPSATPNPPTAPVPSAAGSPTV